MLLKNLGNDFHRSRKCPPVNHCFILAWVLTIKDYAKTDLEAEQYPEIGQPGLTIGNR